MINKDMKLIPKAQYGAQFIAQSDNTRVTKPIIQEKIPYKLKFNEKYGMGVLPVIYGYKNK